MKTKCGIACLVTMLSMTALAFGGSGDAAVLHSSGAVIVNGATAPTTTALFRGDKVQTSEGVVVTISAPGSTVLVPADSQIVFNGGVLDLTSGSASVSTTKGMTAQADKYLVSPATGGTASFEIKRTGSAVLIHASSGVLNVSSPAGAFTLAAGTTATLDSGINMSKGSSLSATAPGGYTAESKTSFLNVERTLSEPSNDGVPICSHAGLCVVPPKVSGRQPCRCRPL